MACGREDRVDGVAFGPREVVTFEMPVLFEVADDRLDPGSPTHLTADGGRFDPSGLAQRDVETFAFDPVPR